MRRRGQNGEHVAINRRGDGHQRPMQEHGNNRTLKETIVNYAERRDHRNAQSAQAALRREVRFGDLVAAWS